MTTGHDHETARVRSLWDRHAGSFDREIAVWERILFPGCREWACAQAEGSVLEVAVGTGRNFRHYRAPTRLTGIEISDRMLEVAQARAASSRIAIDLHVADAQNLPFAASVFDTVVCTISLCNIPDDRRAVAEMARVLRPGGRLVLFEHVASPHRTVRIVQRALDPLTVRFGGDHLLRDPLRHMAAAGLLVEERIRSKAGIVLRAVARKP